MDIISSIELLIGQLKLELSNKEEEQDKEVMNSVIRRLGEKLKPYKEPLFILGSIASILGLAFTL